MCGVSFATSAEDVVRPKLEFESDSERRGANEQLYAPKQIAAPRPQDTTLDMEPGAEEGPSMRMDDNSAPNSA